MLPFSYGLSHWNNVPGSTPEGTRLHFLPQPREKIKVSLGQALASNSPPDCCDWILRVPSERKKADTRMGICFFCIWAHILIESPTKGFTFLWEGVHSHPKGVHSKVRGFTLFADNANNRCKCKTRRLEADNHHIGCNTALSVFLVLYRPRYTNTGRSFA